MPNVDINAEILHVLASHPPVSRKEIHDNLPPGTYNASYSLKDALDNISQRLNALEKRGAVTRSGKDELGIILWSLPDEAMTAPSDDPSIPLIAEPATTLGDAVEFAGLPHLDPDIIATSWVEDGPLPAIPEPLATIDSAWADIRAAFAAALESKPAPKIRNKSATLDALYEVTQALQKLAPTHYQLLMELGAVATELEEA